MKGIGKKNQIMITALAVMIAVAGYLQFADTKVKEEQIAQTGSDSVVGELSSADLSNDYVVSDVLDSVETDNDLAGLADISDEDIEQASLSDIESLDTDAQVVVNDYLEDGMEAVINEEITGTEAPGEAVFTSGAGISSLSDAKLMKEQTRAKNKELYLEIINNAALTEEQKQDAVAGMMALTDMAEKETAAEILLEAKGFQDVVVSMSSESVDVVVNQAELTDAMRAQIEDIIKRKTGMSAEDIVISTVASN